MFKNMSIQKKLVIALVLIGVIPNVIGQVSIYNLVSSILPESVSDRESALASLTNFFLFMTLIGTAGFALLGYILSRSITRPIKDILIRVRERGHLDDRFSFIDEVDEMQVLEKTIDYAFDVLHQRENALKEANRNKEESFKQLQKTTETLRHQKNSLAAHNELLYLISQSPNIDKMCQGFLDKLTVGTKVKQCGIFHLVDGEKVMELVSGEGIADGAKVSTDCCDITTDLFEARKASHVSMEELHTDCELRGVFSKGDPDDLLCSPIVGKDIQVRGMVVAGGVEIADVDAEFINFASFVLGVGMERIEAERRLKEMADDLLVKGRLLNKQNKELIEVDKVRSEFVSLVSHELRTPLNSIIGFSEILIDSMAGELNEKQMEFTRDILGSGLHLMQIVNDILDLSKIEAGYIEMEWRAADMEEEIRRAVRTMAPLAMKKGQEIVIDVGDDVREMITDSGKLSQILLNLLSNAIKFSPVDSTIEVGARMDGEYCRFSVRDYGIGILDENVDKLFKPFVQVDSSHTRNFEGTGLGLAICERLAKFLGGKIWVESSYGEGSTFFFTVSETVSKGKPISKEEDSHKQNYFSRYEEEVIKGRLDSSSSAKMVFILEGKEKIAHNLSEQIKKEGFEVVVFRNEEDLLRIADMVHPEVIALNFLHPDCEWETLLARLKDEESIAEIPLILLTERESLDSEILMSKRSGKIVNVGESDLKEIRSLIKELTYESEAMK